MFLVGKNVLRNNKTILANFSYLTILQIFVLLFPLITYPYLIPIVGLDLWGVVVFAQTIVSYISLVINFGFNVTGAKEIASNRNDQKLISEIVSSIYINKTILWVGCLVIYVAIISIIPFFREHYILYLLSYFLTFNELLFPGWFFQGIEKMKYITFINIFIRSMFVLLIFVFVRDTSDYLYIPLLNSVGPLLGGIISIYIVTRKESVKFILVKKDILIKYIKDAFPIFVSVISISLYGNLNKLVVGTFLGMSEVAIYDIGEKIKSLMGLPLQMAGQATFPKIARERRVSFVNKVMLLVVSLVSLCYVILYFIAPWVVEFFIGYMSQEAVWIIRILGISVILSACNIYLGGNRLVPFGHKTAYMRVMVGNSICYVLVVGILYTLNIITLNSVAFLVVFVELVCFCALLYENNRLSILWNKGN